MIEVQGHRGSRGTKPENSLPGFQEAIVSGADAIEFDVLALIGGELIVYHDFCINTRISVYKDGSKIPEGKRVEEMTLSEIKSIDIGQLGNRIFPRQERIMGTEIPTLQEFFAFLKNNPHPHASHIRLNLEIKRKEDEYSPEVTSYAKSIVDVVHQQRFGDRIAYSSFDAKVLLEIRKLQPKATIGFIHSKSLEEMREIGVAIGASILSPKHTLLQTKEQVENLHGFRVIPWTVNGKERMEELITMGVDGIISDYPLESISYRNGRGSI